MSNKKSIDKVCQEIIKASFHLENSSWSLPWKQNNGENNDYTVVGSSGKIISHLDEVPAQIEDYVVMTANNAPKLAKALMRAQEALASIGSIDARAPEHDSEAYWLGRPHESCAETIAEDTRFARKALADIEEILK